MDYKMAESHGQNLQKKNRKRLKALISQVRQQMEFYFSDANLHKDHFLKQKIEESNDGYVDLEMFLRFNKIRALVSESKSLVKALNKSDLLEMNDEKTKVRRVAPLCAPKDVDHRTVYVECLPATADHGWVKKVFSGCGDVIYVSLPKYKSTGDIKGFAFVEFDTVEAAQLACQTMNNPPASVADKRPGWFPKSKEAKRIEKQYQLQQSAIGRKRHASDSQIGDGERLPAPKRRRTISEGRDKTENVTGKKKRNLRKMADLSPTKISSEQNASKPVVSNEDIAVSGMTEQRTASDDIDSVQCAADSNQMPHKQKYGKKVQICDETLQLPCTEHDVQTGRIKKRKKKTSKDKGSNVPELRVISKSEWLQLRTEYLSIQKANMAQLKQTLRQINQSHSHCCDAIKLPVTDGSSKSHSSLQFTPDVIVYISSHQPLSRKQLKDQLVEVGKVAFIDVKDGETEAYVRCVDSSSASAVSMMELPGCSLRLLAGEDEQKYWSKAAEDRLKRLSSKSLYSKSGRHKHRGRDKILKQAEKEEESQRKHIVFGD